MRLQIYTHQLGRLEGLIS